MVNVGRESLSDKFFRQWPLDFACRNAGRELPFYCRGLAGLARILPIRVPARIHLKENACSDGLARSSAGGGQNQRAARMRGLDIEA